MQNKKDKLKFSSENNNLEIETINRKPQVNIANVNILTKSHRVLGRSKKARWWSDIVFIIITSALIGFLINSYYLSQYKRNIVLEIKSINSVISSGNLETFEFHYKNNNKENVNDINIAMEIPENFIIQEVMPKDIFKENLNIFQIDKLPSGAKGKIKISGIVLGEVNTQQTISFNFNYKKQGISRNLLSSLIYVIEKSKLKTKLEIPEKIYKNIPFSGKITILNTSKNNLKNLKLKFKNDNFKIQSLEKNNNLLLEQNEIKVNNINLENKVEINFIAMINITGKNKLNLESFLEQNNQEYKQGTLEKNIEVKTPKFKTKIESNKKVINENEKINFKINYWNEENYKINNLKSKIFLNPDFEIKSLKLNNVKNVYLNNNELTFKDGLDGNGNGEINLELSFIRKKLNTNQKMNLILENSYSSNGDTIKYKSFSNDIKIISNLNVSSKAFYYSKNGDQLGIGPLPPSVDIPTNYWIFWEVNNFGNNLENFNMFSELPKNVLWTGNKNVPEGNLQYGEISRKITWSLDKINKDNSNYKVGFEISIIPEEKDLGKILNLLENTKFSVKDNFCQQEIKNNLDSLNTNLKYDNLSSGQGKVQNLDF